jgi:hypothetical protein
MSRILRTRRFDPGLEAVLKQLGNRGSRHQHALVHVELESREKCPASEIGQRHPSLDSPAQQRVDARAAPRSQELAVRSAALLVRQARREKNELGRLVARIVRAVTEVNARAAHRPRAALDGGAHRLGCRMG